MKFFTNKSIWTKIVIVLIFVLIFEFIVAKPSLGVDWVESGGKLISPVLSLVVGLGDGVIGTIHSAVMGVDESLITIDLDSQWWEILGRVVIAIVAVAAAAILIVVTGGIGAIILGLAKIAILGYAATFLWDAAGDVSGLSRVKTASYAKESLPDTLVLPAYTISPEEIFKGRILMFNIDFFSESPTIYAHKVDKQNKDGEKIDEKGEAVTNDKRRSKIWKEYK